VQRRGRGGDAAADAREHRLIACGAPVVIAHAGPNVRRQRHFAAFLQEHADVDVVVEAHDARTVGEDLHDRRAGVTDPQPRSGAQLPPRPHQRQPLTRRRVERGLGARSQQQQLGARTVLALRTQPGADDLRLVEHQHVACAQQLRKRRERAVLERAVRAGDEQPRRVALRRRLERDQAGGEVVVVCRGRARRVVALVQRRYDIGTRWRSISRNVCSRR
jgi:choline dehydrogenase-like flavoprotein